MFSIKFFVWAIIVVTVGGQNCTKEEGLTVTSIYSEANGCYKYDYSEQTEYPSFRNLIIPYGPYFWEKANFILPTETNYFNPISEWKWIFYDANDSKQSCYLDVKLSISSGPITENPANGANVSIYSRSNSSMIDEECANAQVKFSCGCVEETSSPTVSPIDDDYWTLYPIASSPPLSPAISPTNGCYKNVPLFFLNFFGIVFVVTIWSI